MLELHGRMRLLYGPPVCASLKEKLRPTLILKCRKLQWAAWWSRNTVEGHWWLWGPTFLLLTCLSAEWKGTLSFRFLLIRINLLLAVMETVWFQDVEMVIKLY